jgi:DNA-directed RNA polymerase subunit beta'
MDAHSNDGTDEDATFRFRIRTVMTCEAEHGACQMCYGRSLATGDLVKLGEAVGIIAAQSIGEPGTQLTMRTFHSGGVNRADITTGLPRVEELFEGRQPKGAALMANKPGVVKIEEDDNGRRLIISAVEEELWRHHLPEGWEISYAAGEEVVKGKTVLATGPDGEKLTSDLDGRFTVDGRMIYVHAQREEREEFGVNVGDQLLVEDGQQVTPGIQLTYGAKDPHQILHTLGAEEVQHYIIDEVQKVYRSQGVNTNDKHIEVICRQMLRKVQIQYPGDTDLLEGDTVDRFEFNTKNDQVLAQGGEPATAIPLLLGITKASLETDSFLSAASFQETTRVLTEAAINGKVDHLRGLKENVIIGKLIPAGSGFDARHAPQEPDALEEATLAAMRQSAEPAEEEDYAELMAGGHIPAVRVLEHPGDQDGFNLQAPEDAGEINTADLANETVTGEES